MNFTIQVKLKSKVTNHKIVYVLVFKRLQIQIRDLYVIFVHFDSMVQVLGPSIPGILCYFCLVFVMFSHLFIAALWSPDGKGLTSWLSFVMFNGVYVTLPCGILGQVWYLIVSIPDLCPLS